MSESSIVLIYDATINSVLENVPENEIVLIKLSYLEYLSERYGDLEMNQKIMDIYISSENQKWIEMSLDDKKAYLIVDENYWKLRDLSAKAEALALERLKEDIIVSKEEALEMIMKMKEYHGKVETYNKDLANQYLSEGSVDLHYASNQSNNMSMRISREIPKKIR